MNKKVILHLSADPVMSEIIKRYGLFDWRASGNLFEDLISAIVGQQLSVKAAASIWKRFEDLIGEVNPENVLSKSHDQLRGVGLSNSKVKYIQGVANSGFDFERISKLSDEEVMKELISLKGVGPWTVEMILIFTLGREDIFSIGDLGLRNAVSKNYGVDRDDLDEILKISQKWSPYRSYASRYLWKSLDNAPK